METRTDRDTNSKSDEKIAVGAKVNTGGYWCCDGLRFLSGRYKRRVYYRENISITRKKIRKKRIHKIE